MVSQASLLLELERKDGIINHLVSKVSDQKLTLQRVLERIRKLEDIVTNKQIEPTQNMITQKNELIRRLTAENAALRATLIDCSYRSELPCSTYIRKESVDELINSFN